MRGGSLSLRSLLFVSIGLAVALVFVPVQRLATGLVALTTEHDERREAEHAAALAARALTAGVRAEALIGDGLACVCVNRACVDAAGAATNGAPSESAGCGAPSHVRACTEGERVCVEIARARAPSTPLRMANALLALVAITVFAAASLLFTLLAVRPLRTLAAEAKRVAEGRPALPPSGSVVREIQDLEGALGTMVDELRAREAELHAKLLEAEDRNADLARTNRALADTRARLLQAERLAAVGRLSAGLAHEIGNPLTAILSLLDLVLAGDLTEAQRTDFLERIRAENERIGAIVRGLVDFSRPDDAHGEFARGTCDAGAVAEELVRFFEPQKRYRHARIAISGSLPTREVRMAGGALRQVLLNLLLNAADALEERGSQGLVLVAFEEGGDATRILVEDDGPGVSASVGDRLFEPFVTGKADRGGTGLGLAVCRGLVEAAGGTLELVRTGPQGTRFALTLPAAT
jgi:signal transduction histidine kinase